MDMTLKLILTSVSCFVNRAAVGSCGPEADPLWFPAMNRNTVRRSPRRVPVAEVQSQPTQGRAAPLRYVDVLAAQQDGNADRRKGERTRDRLKLAAVHALEQRGYLQLRVTDICKKAKVSPAVFYLYFKNKEEITVEVLSEFLRRTFGLDEVPSPAKRRRALFESLVAANLLWIRAIRANSGLTRCLLQLADQVPEFKELASQTNHRWFVGVTERLMRRFPSATVDRDTLLLAVYSLGGMVDELCSKLLVSRDDHVVKAVEAVAHDDEALAEFLSLLWYRALFGADPPRLRHDGSKNMLLLRNLPGPEAGAE